MEWTCWTDSVERGFTGPGEQREIVQVGALLIEKVNNLKEIDSFQAFVKPKINPKLSDYFVKLTNISQQEINQKGIDFPKALKDFYKWAKNYPLYSYSLEDRDVLMENCRIHKIVLPFNSYNFFDVRAFFWQAGIPAEKYHSGNILRAFNKKPRSGEHNALNDAHSIIDGLRALDER